METIADILREIRGYADKQERMSVYDLRDLATETLRVLADRIEAAHEREVGVSKTETTTKESLVVGNGAKIREALERCVKMLDICLLYSCDGYPSQSDDIQRVITKREAALAEPPRNCDLYKTESKAYQAWLKEMMKIPIEARVYFESWLFVETKGE